MTIMAGSTPLALPGDMNSVNESAKDNQQLASTFKRMDKKPSKPPKIKKAFGSSYGKAFK